MSESYKIQLGVDLDTSDIKRQLNKFTDNTHRIRIDIDNSRLLKQIDHAKKELQNLNKLNGNNKPSLDINSASLEKSLDRVANAIDEIKASLSTVDGKSGMQSLLSSINQITTALGKAENETDSLVKSLSVLAKKDFNVNLDFKLGKSNSIDRNTIFGTKVRNDILPELQKQVKAYEDYFANYYKGKYREGSSPLSGLLTGSSVWEKNKTNIIDVNARMADSSHLENQIKAYAQYISIIKEAASLKGIDVSSVDSQFSTSADEIVKNAIEIKTGAKEAKESVEQLKSVFGGINASELSNVLDPILQDLKSIKEAIESLSKGTSIDGLTASFNRLSDVLDKLDVNFDRIKDSLGAELAKSVSGDSAVRTAQQTGEQIGEAVSDGIKKGLDIDSVIDKEVKRLMSLYGIKGNKDSKSFKDIKQSLIDIKLNIELGTYDNQMDDMHHKADSLSREYEKLEASIQQVENAYKEMLKANDANSGDEVADRERLIRAEEQYANALKKTNNLIKIQTRAEKLADKKTALKLDMANYLRDNSRAAREFGAEINDLSARLDNLDNFASVNNIERKFKNLTKTIKAAGKDGLTVFDKFKTKAKEYISYLSAAEVFMYIEQGLREMFNTVLEIDTAMTGLYRVTDLTATQYDSLFNDMINSAKEYGATLNDIINATTDWVRAGFEVDDALGLAEITTMYQHISDLDYDTAAENLITAYNGFKDELNGVFDNDKVAAVEYIADIFNELDKQNCP